MKFSIIVATYNAAKMLPQTIDSLRNQSCSDFELLIIDGLSTDNTIDVIKANSDIVNFWISEKDTGVYDAWNKGITYSTGNWICFLGAGDTLLPNVISRYNEVIESNSEQKLEYISAKINKIDEHGKVVSVAGQPWSWKKMKKRMCVAHVGSMHHKILFNNTKFDLSFKISSDYEFLLRKGRHLNTYFIDEVIGHMPLGGCSFSIDALKEAKKAQIRNKSIPEYQSFIFFIYRALLFKTYYLRNRK